MSDKLKYWIASIFAVLIVIGSGVLVYFLNDTVAPQESPYQFALEQVSNSGTSAIDSAFYGNKDSKLQLTIYLDLQCPACIQFNKLIYPKIDELYVKTNKIGVTFKQFPLPQHKRAVDYANLTYCALKENKFLELKNFIYDYEYSLQSNNLDIILSDDQLIKFTKAQGLNTSNFLQCRKEMRYGKKLISDYNDGIKIELRGTPQLVINGKRLDDYNGLESLLKAFDQILETK